MDTLREKAMVFFTEHNVPVLVGVLGMMFFGYGLIALYAQYQPQKEVVFTPGEQQSIPHTAVKSAQDTERMLVVDVEGGVLRPGVYQVAEKAIIQDAIEAAGGWSTDADRERVAKVINLAGRVIDGGKIYIPKIGEQSTSIEADSGSTGQGTINIGERMPQQMDINSATKDQLDSLPGVGEVTANKIMSSRPYAHIEELVTKKIVNKGVFEKIKEKIVAY